MVSITSASSCQLTDYLFASDTGQMSPMLLYRRLNQGVELRDVQNMLCAVAPRSKVQILRRILGKSSFKMLPTGEQSVRLTPRQSTVAYQYAKAFEHAITTFGSQKLAEDWLSRPCSFLEGEVPLKMVDNFFGYKVIEEYLDRVLGGVYQ